MRLSLTFASALMVPSIDSAMAQVALPEPVSEVRAASPEKNLALRSLQKPVKKIQWDQRSLEEVVEWIKDQTEGLNLLVDWSALEVIGIDRDTAISLSLQDVSVADVLNHALRQLAGSDQLAYRAWGNFLLISTQDQLERDLHVRVYNVTDILGLVPNFGPEAPLIDIAGVASTSTTGTPGPVFSQGSTGQTGQQDEEKMEEKLEALKTVIINAIEPFHWTQAGGPGYIGIFEKALIIRASIEVHEQISGFFAFDQKRPRNR